MLTFIEMMAERIEMYLEIIRPQCKQEAVKIYLQRHTKWKWQTEQLRVTPSCGLEEWWPQCERSRV